MDKHFIQGELDYSNSLYATETKDKDKRQPDRPLGSYADALLSEEKTNSWYLCFFLLESIIANSN